MSEEIIPNDQNSSEITRRNYDEQLREFETGLVNFLQQHNLPDEEIFTPVPQRITVFNNIGTVLPQIENFEELKNSIYLSKFLAATASGLFDAALNYLWDETVLQLRKRVVQYDIKYFYDNAVQEGKRGDFNNEDNLESLKDEDLLLGCKKIGLISDTGYQQLQLIKYMRNHASAAHPNQNQLTGLQLIGWLETCIREVITLPLTDFAVDIKRILQKVRTEPVSSEEAEEIGVFFDSLPQNEANNLGKGLFGIFVNTDAQTEKNILFLIPNLWEHIDEETREGLGIKYGYFAAHKETVKKQNARRFLEKVDGVSYIPDDLLIPEYFTVLEQLVSAHREFNNFYNEPTYVRQLRNKVGDPPSVPPKVERRYVHAIVECFLTNGIGKAWKADSHYRELIGKFSARQAHIALLSFTQDQISVKLQYNLCSNRFIELLDTVGPILTAPEYADLIKRLKQFPTSNLSSARLDNTVKRKIDAVKIAARNLR